MAETRLNIGSGRQDIAGFEPVDRILGKEAYPLEYDDNSVAEIRASHILEHFPMMQVEAVLRDWVRVLKPGGRIRIAVPDAQDVMKRALAGEAGPWEAVLMGSQTHTDDYHHALFNEAGLRRHMRDAGIIRIGHWKSEIQDCASHPWSLNLEGIKAPEGFHLPRARAVLSAPRLLFADHVDCVAVGLLKAGIDWVRFTGGSWGKTLQMAFEQVMRDERIEAIIATDYDTVFTPQHVHELLRLAAEYPEYDAIAPIQTRRGDGRWMGALVEEDVTEDVFERVELIPARSAHFGLTLIRTAALRELPYPWFLAQPGPSGRWDEEGEVDIDVHFWKQFERNGFRLALATHIAVGHIEEMICWPAPGFKAVMQRPRDFARIGPPPEAIGG